MSRKQKLIWLQIICGTAFMLQPIFLPVRPDDIDRIVLSREILKNIVANGLILTFFYLNYYLLIPALYFTKRYYVYFATVLFSLFVILFASQKATVGVPSSRPDFPFPPSGLLPEGINLPPPPVQGVLQSGSGQSVISSVQLYFTEHDQTFFLFGAIVLFSLLLRVSSQYYETENAKQEAEINYLLAQINPHFLFNALNSIYTLTIKENAVNASEGILKLSGLLRYVFTETNNNEVALEKEIACISDFLDLQKLRLTSNVKLEYEVEGVIAGKYIAPMLLMPFIENAFKHGINTDEEVKIVIRIAANNDNLHLMVKNRIPTQPNNMTEKSGLGIANVRNRLQLLYPGKHQLNINNEGPDYIVNLTIQM